MPFLTGPTVPNHSVVGSILTDRIATLAGLASTDAERINLLVETISHEIGHTLSLVHPPGPEANPGASIYTLMSVVTARTNQPDSERIRTRPSRIRNSGHPSLFFPAWIFSGRPESHHRIVTIKGRRAQPQATRQLRGRHLRGMYIIAVGSRDIQERASFAEKRKFTEPEHSVLGLRLRSVMSMRL
jgi:hypothetical protein